MKIYGLTLHINCDIMEKETKWIVARTGVNPGKVSTDNFNTTSNTGDMDIYPSNVKAIIYGKDMWIVIGEDSKASYSYNGENWTPLSNYLNKGLKFNGSNINFIALGRIESSIDKKVGYGFIAVGDDGKASYSFNGIDWTLLIPGISTGLKFGTTNANTIAYSEGTWLVAGEDGKASYSHDGINWTYLTPGAATGLKVGTDEVYSVCKGGGKWIATAGTSKYSYSIDDCVTWATGSFAGSSIYHLLNFNNGLWVACNESNELYSSFDGTTWNLQITGTYMPVSIICIKDYWIVMCSPYYIYSEEGAIWTESNSYTYPNTASMAANRTETRFVAADSSGDSQWTNDGVIWNDSYSETDGIKFGSSGIRSICSTDESTIVAAGEDGKASYSYDGINWIALTPGAGTGIKFDTDTINGLAYAPVSGTFFAVGDGGKWSYSANYGVTWFTGPTDIYFGTNTILDIGYGNGVFVAVGGGGQASYYKEIDGIWVELVAGASTGIKFGTTVAPFSVAYGNSNWVVVGDQGQASYSVDNAATWTILTPGISTGIKFGTTDVALSVTYGGNKFVVVGVNGQASYSYDGVSWTTIDIGFDTSTISKVRYFNGLWIAIGVDNKSAYSDDGITWNMVNFNLDISAQVSGLFPMPYFTKNLFKKYDSINDSWNIKQTFNYLDNDWKKAKLKYYDDSYYDWIRVNPRAFIIEENDWEFTLGDSGFSSADNIRAMETDGTIWVIAGEGGSLSTATDPTGIWTQRTSSFGTSTIYKVINNNGMWVAVGWYGKLATSTDSINWTQRTSSFDISHIQSIATDGTTWVAVGDDGKLATATDPTGTWTQRISGFGTNRINCVATDGTIWVIAGYNGKLATSTDPTGTWTQRTSSFGTTEINSIATDDTTWVAVAYYGKLATATNPTGTWTQRNSGFGSSFIFDVTTDGNIWAIVGTQSKIAITTNPTGTWTQVVSNFPFTYILAISTNGTTWVAVGQSGKLVYCINVPEAGTQW